MSNEIKKQIWRSRAQVNGVRSILSNQMEDRVCYRVSGKVWNNVKNRVVDRFSPVVVNTSRNSFDKAK